MWLLLTGKYSCVSGSIVDRWVLLYPPQTMFVGGYTVFTLSVRPSVRPSERTNESVSETFCFLNILKSP